MSGIRRGGLPATPAPSATHTPTPTHELTGAPYLWLDKQEVVQRELEEARARAAQMEKTMRWWSDCTANWREKWSKVRSERNRAREEVRLLRMRLEGAEREAGRLKTHNRRLEDLMGKSPTEESPVRDICSSNSTQMRRQPQQQYHHHHQQQQQHYQQHQQQQQYQHEYYEQDHELGTGLDDGTTLVQDSNKMSYGLSNSRADLSNPNLIVREEEEDDGQEEEQFGEEDHVDPPHWPHEQVGRKGGFASTSKSGRQCPSGNAPRCSPNNTSTAAGSSCCCCNSLPSLQDAAAAAAAADITGSLTRQICLLRMQLHEAGRALQLEREERCDLSTSAARYQTEAADLQAELHSVRCSRQEALQQVECLRSQLQQLQHQQHQQLLQETAARQMAEAKLAELRADIERLQTENAAEWSRREHLESEALNWERSNKALKAQVEELLERLKPLEQLKSSSSSSRSGKGGGGSAGSGDPQQNELTSLREQVSELNLYVSQYKKALSCKTVECDHSCRRAEHYEVEVKRLRQRVTKLRQDLASTQDELDTAHNAARRLTRSRDELQDTVDTLQLKLNHMQSRLRCTGAAVVSSRTTALKKMLPPHCDTDEDTA
ncbi:hypothetical protein FHG87_023557 [Trinorchestia longiramus]|nr:hypothetical protein FHG87_023557 [Trinorchestia longiramus]